MSTLHCVVQVTPRFISKLRNQPCERHALYGLASQAVRPNVTVEVYIQTSLLPCLSKSRYSLIRGTCRHTHAVSFCGSVRHYSNLAYIRTCLGFKNNTNWDYLRTNSFFCKFKKKQNLVKQTKKKEITTGKKMPPKKEEEK